MKHRGNNDITNFLDVERDIMPLAKKCLALGAKAVMIKCGAPGLFLMTSDKMAEINKLELDGRVWNNFCRP